VKGRAGRELLDELQDATHLRASKDCEALLAGGERDAGSRMGSQRHAFDCTTVHTAARMELRNAARTLSQRAKG
jgi:hypothetical protein